MSNPPKDLKSVKKRIRAWRIFARIVKCAFITFAVLCFLMFIGYMLSMYLYLSQWGSIGDGRNPLPPAKPKLRYARTDCINDVKKMMRYERFEASQSGPYGETTYFYNYSEIKVAILQEYDYCPYYVFYGRVRLTKPELYPSHPLKDVIPSERETDFFLVNAFNSAAAGMYRGDGYSPEHYIWKHVNFGYQHPRPGQRNPWNTALPSSMFGN